MRSPLVLSTPVRTAVLPANPEIPLCVRLERLTSLLPMPTLPELVPEVLVLKLTLYPLPWKVSWLTRSVVVKLPVAKLFLPALTAASVLLITPPTRLVLPATLTPKPPSPARNPLCCVALAKLPSPRMLLA
ncbi:hypothetical protein ASC78_12715 [Variovorax sp. Root318D1]|nr:hypothetical protein ASC78_12715 [Variovorax sp. Root318D1]